MKKDIEKFLIDSQTTIQQAVFRMCENRLGIILVVDSMNHLLGTITDGDIRRSILAAIPFDQSVQKVLDQKSKTKFSKPLTAPIGQDRRTYLYLLKQHQLLHLPLLDGEGCVVDLVAMDEFVADESIHLQAVVMAGGSGKRLLPLTKETPKPMLLVGDKPLLEIMVAQFRSMGIRQVHVTTHHKPEKIKEYFGDGSNFGTEISYVSEDRPLGTAGALGFLKNRKDPLLVVNGDILTEVDFKAMFQFHKEHEADLTVGIRSYDLEVPYGVVQCDGVQVQGVQEKPKVNLLVNAGIYLLEPILLEYIPNDKEYHMTDLIARAVQEKKNVVSFPIHEYWLDIGEHVQYQEAQKKVKGLL